MKNRRFSDARIVGILRQAEGGVPVTELCREHGMSNASFYIYGRLSHCTVFFEVFLPVFPWLQTSIRRHRLMVRPNRNSAW
tara:strand:- start:414 stop:656 length:243 start_codon:yes stop_codon:yes gene_type:complete